MTSYMTANVLPACKITLDRNIELIWKIYNLPEEKLTETFYFSMYGWQSPQAYREQLIDLIREYWELQDRNDVSTIYAGDNLPYFVTGGMTNGDSPTDPFDTIAMLAEVIWDELLEYVKEDWSLISSREVAEARVEAKSYFLGVDDIVIQDNATVQKVSDGYCVEAQVWVDADYSDSLSI